MSENTWFWLPQVEAVAGGVQHLPLAAAQQVVKLFGNRAQKAPWASKFPTNGYKKPFSINGFSSELLLKLNIFPFDKENCYIFGICSFEKAVESSWDAYGLNLFDLPWGISSNEPNTKAIRYVPVLNLPAILQEADRHARYPKTVDDWKSVTENLHWAFCHYCLKEVWLQVRHGRRDDQQVTPIDSIKPPEWNTKLSLPCGEGCSSKKRLCELTARWNIRGIRDVANLDCQKYKLAMPAARAFFDVPHIHNYQLIVIVEDNEGVRHDLGRRFLEMIITDAPSNLFSINGFELVERYGVAEKLREQFLDHGIWISNSAKIIEFDNEIPKKDDLPAWGKDFVCAWRHSVIGMKMLPGKARLIGDHERNQEFILIPDNDKKEKKWAVHRQPLAFADPKKTIEHAIPWRLDDTKINTKSGTEKDTRIDIPDVYPNTLGAGTLFCFDLELQNEDQRNNREKLPSGLFILYKMVMEYPFSSRLVITGYRLQDHASFNTGAGAFLLKPFTQSELKNAVVHSLPFRAVWDCPHNVQEDWMASLPDNGKTRLEFKDSLFNPLCAWAAQRGIQLEHAVSPYSPTIRTANVVILDMFTTTFPEQSTSSLRLAQIKTKNPDSQTIVLLPMKDEIFAIDGLLEQHGRMAKDGMDSIAYKPLWLFTDSPTVSSIGQALLGAIQSRPKYDVKYIAITPLMGLVWAKCGEAFLMACQNGSELLTAWGPLVVLLAQVWGFQFPVKSLAGGTAFREFLRIAFVKETENNNQRWKSEQIDVEAAIDRFIAFVKSPVLDPFRTAEMWLSDILNQGPFTQNLTKLFGGETTMSLGSRGAWYNENQRVEDLNLVIEFCGRRGIVGRGAIRNYVVSYLKNLGAEELVLFQEVPLKAYLD